MKSTFLKIGLAWLLVLAFMLPAEALDGVVVIANKSVQVSGLSAEALKDIYTGKKAYWDNGETVVIIVVSGKPEDAAISDISGMDAGQFKTFWQRMVFSGRGQQPRRAYDTNSLVAMVAATKGAIAIVSTNTELKDVTTLQVK